MDTTDTMVLLVDYREYSKFYYTMVSIVSMVSIVVNL
jgi:hypothetical protein